MDSVAIVFEVTLICKNMLSSGKFELKHVGVQSTGDHELES